MDIQFDDGIKRARFPLVAWLTSRQAFWVLVAVLVACVFLSFATNSFATSNNLFNVTRNFTFVAVVALGMTIVIITGGIDLSLGSLIAFSGLLMALLVTRLDHSLTTGSSIVLGVSLALLAGVLLRRKAR